MKMIWLDTLLMNGRYIHLFYENGMLRKTPKSKPADVLPKPESCKENDVSMTYVIDGGFLLYRVVWPDKQSSGIV